MIQSLCIKSCRSFIPRRGEDSPIRSDAISSYVYIPVRTRTYVYTRLCTCTYVCLRTYMSIYTYNLMHSALLFWFCCTFRVFNPYYKYNKLLISNRELSIYKVDNSELYLNWFCCCMYFNNSHFCICHAFAFDLAASVAWC